MAHVALSQQLMQQLQTLMLREQHPRPVDHADVQQQGVELCQLLAQHQGHLNSITGGEVPPLKALVDGLVAAGVLLARRRTVVQDAMQALQDTGADVSTLSPLVGLLQEGLTQSAAQLAVINISAGQRAQQDEEVSGVDSQVQLQEVQRLAAMWQILQGDQQQQINPAEEQGGAQGAGAVPA